MHSHHSHHREQVFELLHEEHHHGCCDHHDHPVCGHVHKIAGTNIPFKVGDFIYWNSTTEAYALAIENHCDLMVTKVNQSKTWFEAANLGDFELKNYTLQGELYLNSAGELTNTVTNTRVGFIDKGHLYLLIEQSTSLGNQGPQGAIGPQGPQGSQGNQGLTGSQGATGSQGPQGNQGAVGAIGPQGNQGAVGAIGPQGNQGAVGAQGSQGNQGNQGSQGNQGAVGAQGPQGATGSQGAQGSQGNQGDVGAQGPQGAQGSNTLDGLTDVDTTGAVTGDLIRLESDGVWRKATITISTSTPTNPPGVSDAVWYVVDP